MTWPCAGKAVLQLVVLGVHADGQIPGAASTRNVFDELLPASES